MSVSVLHLQAKRQKQKKFAGGIRPIAYVQPITFGKKTIDVIVIHNDRNTPYYLTEQYQGVFANNIYARIMDTNTPKNASADINIIEKLWKKQFGIDATALDRALLFLQKPYDWVDSNDGKSFISMLLNLHSKLFKLRMVEMVMNFICSISVIRVLGGMT